MRDPESSRSTGRSLTSKEVSYIYARIPATRDELHKLHKQTRGARIR